MFMVLSFFGNRDFFEFQIDRKKLINLINNIIKEEKVDVYLGLQGNFDSFALSVCREMKLTNDKIKIYFVPPYFDSYIKRMKEITDYYFDGIILPEISIKPERFAIIRRNKWIIDQSDVVFCYTISNFGGAYTCLKYAQSHNKKVIDLRSTL